MWFNVFGKEMSDEEWSGGHTLSVAVLLSGQAMHVYDSRGKPIVDDTFVLIL